MYISTVEQQYDHNIYVILWYCIHNIRVQCYRSPYVNSLEELPERTKTATRQKPCDDNELNDTELGENLATTGIIIATTYSTCIHI